MIACCECKILLLPVNNLTGHGEVECPDCGKKQYAVGEKSYPMEWVTIDHDKQEIRIEPPEEDS